MRSPSSLRRRRATRSRRRLEGWLPKVALLLCLAAFGAGFFWKVSNRQQPKTQRAAAAPIDATARDAALSALDEALRARHEKRTSGSLAALVRAREADPSLPGLDIAFAEIAFNERQFVELRRAVAAAKAKDDHADGAAVLLGVDKWMTRGASEREMLAAADSAGGQFAEATELDFFAAPAWFFWADVLRYAGREDEGLQHAQAALHRYQPWDSSDVIAAKVIFAAPESGDAMSSSLVFLPDSPWVRALEDFAENAVSLPGAPGAQAVLRCLASDSHTRRSSPGLEASLSGFSTLPWTSH